VAEPIEDDDTPWGRKVQSAALLALLVSVLGIAAAAIAGVLLVALASFVDQALG
jgi:hypothetical protein